MTAEPAATLVADHVWRAPHGLVGDRGRGLALDRPCEFMNCRRPRAEHERAVSVHRRVKR